MGGEIRMNSEILDLAPPHSLDAERQLLGSIMLQPSIMDAAASIVSPADFYTDSHNTIYGHLVEMSQHGHRIDTSLFLDRLRVVGDLERVGGSAGLFEIFASVSNPIHWRQYAQIIQRDAQKRVVIGMAYDALYAAYDPTTLPEELIGQLEMRLADIRTGQYDTDPVTMSAACVEAINEIDETIRRGKGAGILTGLPSFDEQIGGFFPSELAIVAARPKQGKTSLTLQMAAHAASTGKRVYFATLEMSRSNLAMKRLCAVSGVSSMRIRTGSINRHEQSELIAAAQSVAIENFHLHDWPEIRPFDIQRAARRLKAEIIFVDYLQIVPPPDAKKKRYEQVGDITRQLRLVARQMKIPVVACCQIGRQAEQGKEGRPLLSHLRESGNIEQDADSVFLLWRPDGGIKSKTDEEYGGDSWDADLIVGKNRLGTDPILKLDWHGDATTFSSHNYTSTPQSGAWTPDSAFT